jgi:hypothetical protein
MKAPRPCTERRPCAQPRARAPPLFVMFMRFVLPFTHWRSNRATGIFHGVYQLYDQGRFAEGDAGWLREEIDWFNRYLPAPRTPPDWRAVFWFRPDAGEAITRIWTFVRLAEGSGVPVHIYRTRRPGIVVYSDEYQIAAIPWRDTFAERAHSRA